MPCILWRAWAEGELDANRRLLQALNCLLIETPAGRVLVETGIGERLDDKDAAMREYAGTPVVPAMRAAGFDPASVDVVAMSHLHFDHAGGLLLADGDAGVPAGADRRPARGVGDRARRQPPARRLVRPAGAAARRATGARRAGPRATASCCPACRSIRTGGHSAGHQAIVVRGTGPGARALAFFGDLCMRPWAANPRWVTAFDDFPLDSVEVKGELFRRAVEEDWLVALSHESRMPVGTLVPDRDRYRFEGL